MTVTPSAWQQYDQGYYVEMVTGETNTFAVDLINELNTGDELSTVTATTSTGITVSGVAPRYDTSIRTTPHQMIVVLTATQTGVFNIQLKATTTQGLTHVKHFDVLVER